MTPEQAERLLDEAAMLQDAPLDVARVALALSKLSEPERDLAESVSHIETLALDNSLPRASATAGPVFLSAWISGNHGYSGDRESYNDLRNADLASVIERRRGLPVALGILYIHVARGLGWEAFGLNTPGHFLIAVQGPGFQSIVDPFNDGMVVSEEDLARLMRHVGVTERLVVTAVPDRSILLRLQNNILLRARDAGDRPAALETALRMRRLAPDLAGLAIETSDIQAELGEIVGARETLTSYLDSGHGSPAERNRLQLNLDRLNRSLN